MTVSSHFNPGRCRRPFQTAVFYAAVVIASTALAQAQPSRNDAARFLEQATFGPNSTMISDVQAMGFAGFIEQQFTLATSSYPDLPLQPTTIPPTCTGTCIRDNYTMYPVQVTFFKNALTKDDQLRQRVAFALQQIMVTSGLTVTQPSWMTPYLQIFDRNAFGNFRTLLYDITLNPAMGNYLNMAGNTKTLPNENYGREVLQLFSIGTTLLNPDGTNTLDPAGTSSPVPSYTQAIVDAFSRVFTGWNFNPNHVPPLPVGTPNYSDPMTITAASAQNNHDGNPKTLLNGVTLPANPNPPTMASANRDLNDAIDNIFNHQNVGPFIGRNLIEHLVTSNPSPAYIARVTAAFNDNGSGVRGDMKAVIRAILLDPEARNPPDANFGHLQEPVLFICRLLRAFDTNANFTDFVLADSYLPTELRMGQDLFRAGSVFNYYPPIFNVPVVNVNGPEFAIQSTSSSIARINFVGETTYHRMTVDPTNRPKGTWLDLSSIATPTATPSQMVDALNTLMLHGAMSTDLRTTVINLVQATPGSNLMKAQRAVYLIGSSPEYFVER